jgi:eukaryotic-like serine/threonine-protein kinase
MSQELQQLRPGDVFAGRYRVVRLIRAGGMGAVYEAEDTATRRHRALKLMHPSLVQSPDSRMRFQREVFIGAELETEHVVEVLDAGLDQQTQVPYLTMELLKGEELGDRLERTPRMSAEETVSVLSQVARALDKAHGKGIVHRDLKPENIYLTFREDGTVRAKILDFGIAKLVEEGAKTNATQAAGTPLYMAPEQTERAGHVSPATDIWAVGLVAYRMLVGDSYWSGDSLQQLYRQILMDPITSAVERAAHHGVQLPPSFDHWFARCVARNPQERFQSAGQAMQELANVFGVTVSRPIGFTPPPPQTQPRMPGAETAPPVVNMTPGNTPHPATMFGGATQYAQPHITPAPNGPYTTPMPGPSPFGTPPPGAMGTQVASPEMMHMHHGSSTSGAMLPVSPASLPKKGGNGALIAGVLVGVAAVGAAIFFIIPSKTPASDPKVETEEKDKKKEEKKPVEKEEKKESLADLVDELNPFLNVGDKGFALHKHEVTREEYATFLSKADKKKAKKPLEGDALKAGGKDGKLPVTWVTYEMAEAYCQAIGARLPTAPEWDQAVAGPDKRKFPWGNDWPAKNGDLSIGKGASAAVLEVGVSTKDRGPYGHVDLAGNVQEWTSTDTKIGKMLRGADVGSEKDEFEQPGDKFTEATAPSGAVNLAKAGEHLGFRCAKDSK